MRSLPLFVTSLAGVLVLVATACTSPADGDRAAAAETASSITPTTPIRHDVTTTTRPPSSTTAAPPSTTTTTTVETHATAVGQPYGIVEGLTMFRGNPTRSYHGSGPIPDSLEVAWRYPSQPMCGTSTVGGEEIQWCGTGWTGQPVVWERPDGITEVIFGAYDKNIHFLDASTGEPTRPRFPMGDIIKGSVTLDPDGYPLLYAGSRDSNFRIIALDRVTPQEVWRLSAFDVPGIWNNDWDSNPVVVDGVMYLGGENSWWYAVALNRSTGDDGRVAVDPEIVFDMPAFTPELRAAVGNQQSVENSTLVVNNTAFFANSAGRIVGVDVSDLPDGGAEVVFDYWVGDDVDATLVADDEGYVYVSAEVDLRTARSTEVGQLVKLDPGRPEDPLVWGIDIPGTGDVDGGIWATPAVVDGLVYVPTNPGELLVVDAETGDVVWRDSVGTHAWSSPSVIGNRMVVAVDCEIGGGLRIYDITNHRTPQTISDNQFSGGCIESTPAVWNGDIYVGSRDGYFYALSGPAS